MPTVPKLTRQVEAAPLPGARLTAAETPESQGAQIGAAEEQQGAALAHVGAKTAALGEELYDRERQHQDNVIDMANHNALASTAKDLQLKALATRGQAAIGISDQIDNEFTQAADKIEATLSNPRQRERFSRTRAELGMSLSYAVRSHTIAEGQKFEASELDAFLGNRQTAAVDALDDPKRVEGEINRQADAIRTHAPSLGLGPEQTQATIAKATSQTLVGVIEKALADEHPATARAYFASNKDQIEPAQVARLERALHEGTVRKESQKQADAILAAGGTLTEQREKARAIDDPDVRDAVMQRIEHESDVREKVQRDNDEAALKAAYNSVDQYKSIAKIPPTAWVSFTGGERASLRAYAERVAKGEPVDTDWTQYYRLMSVASTDPASFASTNLLSYRGYLGDSEFKQVVDLQASIRNKDANAANRVLDGVRTNEQIVNDTLVQYGIDPKDKDKAPAIAQLRRMLDQRIDAAQADGKKVTNVEIQQTLDGLMGQSVTTPGSWWGLIPFNGVSLSATKKKLVDMTSADIPDAERKTIEQALRDNGRTVTDATVLDTYLNVLVRRNYKAGR